VTVTATTPLVCNESTTIDQDGGTDKADIAVVSPDGSETVNATSVVSEDDWTPIPVDKHGRPFSVQVRPVQHCSSWKFSRVFFEIKGADKFRIRIGDVYVIDWVRNNAIVTAYKVKCR